MCRIYCKFAKILWHVVKFIEILCSSSLFSLMFLFVELSKKSIGLLISQACIYYKLMYFSMSMFKEVIIDFVWGRNFSRRFWKEMLIFVFSLLVFWLLSKSCKGSLGVQYFNFHKLQRHLFYNNSCLVRYMSGFFQNPNHDDDNSKWASHLNRFCCGLFVEIQRLTLNFILPLQIKFLFKLYLKIPFDLLDHSVL